MFFIYRYAKSVPIYFLVKIFYIYAMPDQLSYWEKESFYKFDIIIIGSGIVGLNAAIYLKEKKGLLKVAVLERGFLPSGASTKNAGFACFGSVSELIEQESIVGTEGLVTLVKKRWDGLSRLRKKLGDKTIDYRCLGGFELFKNNDVDLSKICVSKIEHFNHIIKDVVGKDAFNLSNEKITAFGFQGVNLLIANKYEAQIDTGKMMFALTQYAQKLGVSIFNNCDVKRISQNENNLEIATNNGLFTCSKVAVATNAFVKTLLPEIDIVPGRGQVLITKPIKNLKVAGTFHYDKGYYYFRNINNRILLGGGRNLDFKAEETTELGQTERVKSTLKGLLKDVILPNEAFEIDYSWSGIMAFGNQLAPLIDEVRPNIFCATRCNGMGVAIGSQTGADLAEMILQGL